MKQKREKTKHHTTHLTPSQIQRVKKLGQRLDFEDIVPGCGEAELMRAAIEMLLDLPEPALLAVIEKNRAKEKSGGYGIGYLRRNQSLSVALNTEQMFGDRAGYIYILQMSGIGVYKIGHSITPEQRAVDLQTGAPLPIELIHKFRTADMRKTERDLHQRYAEYRQSGEWFALPQLCLQELLSMR